MKDTRCGKNCAFVKSGFCSEDSECPFFTQAWWKGSNEEMPILVSDCFCKRSTIEQNNLINKVENCQSDVVDVRNRLSVIENLLTELVVTSREAVKEAKETGCLLENKSYISLENNPM